MPTAPVRETILRQWQLLMHLPREPLGITVTELLTKLKDSGFSVTPRTVQRDLQKLLFAQLPIVVRSHGQLQYWSIMKDGRVALPELPSISDALLLVMVREYLTPLLPPPLMRLLEPTFASADALLQSTRPSNNLSRWKDKVRAALPTQPLLAPQVERSVQSAVGEAVLQDRLVAVHYLSRSRGDSRELELNPVALLQRGMVTYLVATCPPHVDVRLYALHRMLEARVLQKPAVAAEGFVLDDYLARGFADFGKGQQIRLQLLVAPSVATHLTECRLSHDQTVTAVDEPVGWYRIEATVNDTPQLLWWLRGFGDEVRVVSPGFGDAADGDDVGGEAETGLPRESPEAGAPALDGFSSDA